MIQCKVITLWFKIAVILFYLILFIFRLWCNELYNTIKEIEIHFFLVWCPECLVEFRREFLAVSSCLHATYYSVHHLSSSPRPFPIPPSLHPSIPPSLLCVQSFSLISEPDGVILPLVTDPQHTRLLAMAPLPLATQDINVLPLCVWECWYGSHTVHNTEAVACHFTFSYSHNETIRIDGKWQISLESININMLNMLRQSAIKSETC